MSTKTVKGSLNVSEAVPAAHERPVAGASYNFYEKEFHVTSANQSYTHFCDHWYVGICSLNMDLKFGSLVTSRRPNVTPDMRYTH